MRRIGDYEARVVERLLTLDEEARAVVKPLLRSMSVGEQLRDQDSWRITLKTEGEPEWPSRRRLEGKWRCDDGRSISADLTILPGRTLFLEIYAHTFDWSLDPLPDPDDLELLDPDRPIVIVRTKRSPGPDLGKPNQG
jgi:hypothetical protein